MNYLLLGFALVLTIACQKPSQHRVDLHPTWTFPNFVKVDSINPILSPSREQSFVDPITQQEVLWEARNVLNPTAVVREGRVHLLYRAQDESGTSRIGMAISDDGLHFVKQPEPVFHPSQDDMYEWEWNYRKRAGETVDPEACISCYFDGTEDPRIVEGPDGGYIMTYTAYDGKTARLAVAFSSDLFRWRKGGLVIKGEGLATYWSKSGAIVAEQRGSRTIAKRINGLYWMYFGDTELFLATSKDLIQWEVLKSAESGAFTSVLHPRPGYFDSRLVEPGPFALSNDDGIVLIYNSSNAANSNDPTLPVFTYAAGQALFDGTAPYRLVDRTDQYFIYPDKEYERVGEVNDVCFVEGLVYFKGRWMLYYGTADSKIAVAVSPLEGP